jgi:hypothetical protein
MKRSPRLPRRHAWGRAAAVPGTPIRNLPVASGYDSRTQPRTRAAGGRPNQKHERAARAGPFTALIWDGPLPEYGTGKPGTDPFPCQLPHGGR